ncbi:SPOR domain-containing protein [Porticoccus sp. GXU_MW_L64]
MSRDYSNYGKGKKRSASSRGQTTRRKAPAARKKTAAGRNGGMFWFVSGLAVGSLATAMILVPEIRPELGQDTAITETRPAPVEQSEPEFEFHSLLRHDEVVVQQEAPIREVEVSSPVAQQPPLNSDAATPESQAVAPVQAVTGSEMFFVQAGSFSKQQDAETRRVQLMLMNFTNADIENVRASAGQTRYRVIVGPFDSQRQMTTALNRISSQGIETLPIKRKR